MEERNYALLEEDGDLPRKVMTLFMLIDTSSSMSHEGNIGKVNRAVENTIQQLRDVSDTNFDAEIQIAILSFGSSAGNSNVQWETKDRAGIPRALPMNEVVWNDLEANGYTPMGEAFVELESKLSRSAFLNSATGCYAPVLVLLSDGYPTDDITIGLEKLSHNNWFRVATRVAIAVTDAATDVLAKFTGNINNVIRYDRNKYDLQQLLTTLTVVSSTMQSRSRGANELGVAAENGMEADSEIAMETAGEAVARAKEESAAPNAQIQTGW